MVCGRSFSVSQRKVSFPCLSSLPTTGVGMNGLSRSDTPTAPAPGIERLEAVAHDAFGRSEEHTSELQSLMRISYAVFCLKKKKKKQKQANSTALTILSTHPHRKQLQAIATNGSLNDVK